MKFSYEVSRYKLIYVFGAPDDAHKGLLKIGDTTISTDLPAKKLLPNCKELNRAAHERIRDYMNNAGVPYKLLHTELAVTNENKTFRDYAVHDVLKHSGIKNYPHGKIGKEWFRVDLKTAILAIAAVKSGKKFLSGVKPHEIPEEIIFRPEQETAINKTVKYFLRGEKTFLWNAKMRFGKTLCALEVVRQMNFAKTIIVTHRPVVDSGWFGDFKKIFGDNEHFIYGEKGSDFKSLLATKKNFVYFASIQYLRGSKTVGGKHNKNQDVFGEKWDFVIVDEAHEGTQTALGDKVIKALVKKSTKFLALSGTPFNLIADYKEENTFTWNYVDEQREKLLWDKKFLGIPNPYSDLPQMKILTYDLGELLQKIYLDAEEEISFSFREFFRTNCGKFVHEDDVQSFLNLLVKEDDNNYPFANENFRDMFRHTFWRVPSVESAEILAEMLNHHHVFGDEKFKIVNVSGDCNNALELVRDAIKKYERTITISCGRLTTGVTVPEWTAVFMLDSSAETTSAQSYFQTIFRVQTPCKFGDKIKTNCYVFDFAPDRTLKLFADYVEKSTRIKKIDKTTALGEILQFCPVIAVEGSEMKPLHVDNFVGQLKRAQAERVVRNGFADNYLYSDELLTLDELDIKKFDTLRKIVGKSQAQPKSSDIVVNAQGLNKNERKKLRDELKREPTDEEIAARLRTQIKNSAISILRGVSIRMPLMIYGADVPFNHKITIDKFAALVDDDSWAEFMPTGVTKELFADFIKYYDPNIFVEACKRVRKRAKDADSLNPTDRVKKIAELFATFKNPDKETVLTPWRVVNLHLSEVFGGFDFFDANHEEILDSPRQIPTEIFRPDKKILEINSKTGLYPLYVAYSIFRAEFDKNGGNPLEIWDKIVAENVFVICKTPMAKTITRRTLLGYRDGIINAHCFDDLINTLKNKPKQFLKRVTSKNFWNKGAGFMFFDAVVGNPPYQTASTGDNKNYSAPVYHEFIKIAYGGRLANHASLIHPARFLSNAGDVPKDFIDKFLADKHVKVAHYEPDEKKFFPTSVIKGGVAITEFDSTKTFEPIGLFFRFDELKPIHEKVFVDNPSFKSFSDIVCTPVAYRLSEKFFAERPELICKLQKPNDSALRTNIFERLPEIFLDDKPLDGHEYIQILGRLNNRRVYKFVRREYITDDNLIDRPKVFLNEANGTGEFGETLTEPQIIGEGIGCTQTFITVGAFETRAEAENCMKYIKSKFARALLGILKVTQHNPPQTWAKVPLQDFTGDEIDWSGDVDAQLFSKYGLSDAEIAFIESKVKEMS